MRHTLILALSLACALPAFASKGAGVDGRDAPSAWEGPTGSGTTEVPWWETLGDARLSALVNEVLAQNLDLDTARERIVQARAQRDQALSAVLPQLSLDGSINAQPANRRFVGFTGVVADDVTGLFYQSTIGFNAALDIDLFGRSVLGVQAAGMDARAAQEDTADQALTLASRVAAAWYDVAVQETTYALVQEQVQANRDLLEVAEMRLARGEASAVDVLQQRQQVAAAAARLPLAEAGRRAAVVQLATLLGRAPEDAPTDLPTEIPPIGPAPAAAAPAALDDARPDLRAAEARLTAAWQRRMQAERQFLPTLRLSANAGWSFTNNAGADAFGGGGGTTDLFGALFQEVAINREAIRAAGAPLDPVAPPPVDDGGGSREGFQSWFNWGFGGQISIPLVLGGRNIATLRAARANERIAARTLESRRLTAWSEVEAALTTDQARRTYVEAIDTQTQTAAAALAAARDRYAEGVGDYLTLLSALVAKQNADLALVAARRDALTARISLHDALGGAWTRELPGGAP